MIHIENQASSYNSRVEKAHETTLELGFGICQAPLRAGRKSRWFDFNLNFKQDPTSLRPHLSEEMSSCAQLNVTSDMVDDHNTSNMSLTLYSCTRGQRLMNSAIDAWRPNVLRLILCKRTE
eukprot:g29333.t1